jgi:glutamine cyclotransferase
MDSQGRSRLIIGGLTLAAVVLVISLLMTQQRTPLMVEQASPLASEMAATEPARQAGSPLVAPDTGTASDNGALSAALPITRSIPATETAAVPESTPVTVTAWSTVTVTLVARQPLLYGYKVVATYPHDAGAFTQGLQYVDGRLYEGTGLNGYSTLRRVNLTTGEVEQRLDLAEQYFGEGIAVIEDRIYQLTWQSNVAFLYDRESFELVDQFSYPTEGWGLTFDGQDLIMSDGSSTLFRRDPETFAEVGRIEVTDRGTPVNRLNELEHVGNQVWANVWQTDEIVMIDPANGRVTARLDLAGLLPSDVAANADVLNGIAYDAVDDLIFVTGKFWPTLFEIELVPR